MKIKSECPLCHKELKLTESYRLDTVEFYSYQCGHTFTQEPAALQYGNLDFTSTSGRYSAFDFQKDGIKFIFDSGFNCLIADPMGLGKTIQAALAARNAQERFKKILCIVRSATVYQWYNELREWYSPDLWTATIINGTKSFILPGFNIYIISMDTLSRIWKANNGTKKQLQELGIDLVIVDECHSFKDPSSSRSQALISFLQDFADSEYEREITASCATCGEEWKAAVKIKCNLRMRKVAHTHGYYTESCPECHTKVQIRYDLQDVGEQEIKKGVIMLSGTPIKNRAEEYFVPLNIMRPDLFTSFDSFKRNWLEQDPYTHKYNRLKPWRVDQFRELTESFIIRREKSQVLSLPPFRRTFERINIEDESFKKAYNRAIQIMEEDLGDREVSWRSAEPHLMTLRRIIGTAKIAAAVDYVEDFLESVEDEKIAIGIHHEAVRDTLYQVLTARGYNPLKLSGEDSAERKNNIVHAFEKSERRLLIVNMLAGGVGLNLQMCNNVLILERQWSAADEEQFEGRFNRQGQTRPVQCEYLLAAGIPIEDFFTNLVEQKRLVCGETLDGWDLRSDPEALKELVSQTLRTRL